MDVTDILERFERHEDGSWTCLDTATIETARGPLTIRTGQIVRFGERVEGTDLAEFLEQLGAQFGS